MMKLKRAAAGLLAAAMVCSLASCGGDTTWTFRSGSNTVTSGMYVGLSIEALNAASGVEGYDSTKSPFDQSLEGSDGEKWIQATANQYAREYLAVEDQFAQRGLSLSEEDQAAVSSQVTLYWTTLGMGTIYEEEGCNETSYTNLVTNQYKRNLLFESIYGEGGEKEVPQSDLESAFQEDYAKGVYFSVSLLDDEGEKLTGDELESKQNEAETLAERIRSGEDIEAVKAAYLADPESDGEAEPGDTAVVVRKDSASSTVYQAIAEGEVGEVQVVEDDSNAYVVQTLDVMTGTSFEDYRATVLQGLKGDEFEETVAGWAEELSIEENTAAVNKHNPSHLKDLFN